MFFCHNFIETYYFKITPIIIWSNLLSQFIILLYDSLKHFTTLVKKPRDCGRIWKSQLLERISVKTKLYVEN